MSHFQANMGAWNPGGNDKLVNRLVGCLWPSWRHSKVKLTTSRTSRIFENGGVVVVVVFFWCIKDQCGFTFDQGNSLIISWKLRDKAFWSILVCSRFGKLCVRVVVFRSHKCRQIVYLATERNVIWRRESARVIDPLNQMKREYDTI